MSLPLNKIKELLTRTDEVTVLELLDLSSADLVHAFHDRIVKRQLYIAKELEYDMDVIDSHHELDFDE